MRFAMGVGCGEEEVVVKLPIMSVTCGWCGTFHGVKHGQGKTGHTSCICTPCVEQYFPEVVDEFKRRTEDSGEAALGMAPVGRCVLRPSEVVFRQTRTKF